MGRSTASTGAKGDTPKDPDRTVLVDALGDTIGERREGLVVPGMGNGPGGRLGPYALGRRLGAGGMGEVFEARHVQTDQMVALKILSTTTATRLYRFKREFRMLADVSHPNLVGLHELVVPHDGPAFFTMELLDGQPFSSWVRSGAPRGELPELERLEQALRQLVAGVHHLHEQGCIHRDLKPSNVLVTREGRVVVLDFGLISELAEPDQGITRERQILGTPSYMAPEQARGEPTGPAADVYAIGVMLFECLTGHLPHEGDALQQLMAKQDATVDPGLEVAGIPEPLRMLCVRLLTRDPSARPGARELLVWSGAADTPQTGPASVFVGRKAELDALGAAFDELTSRREPVIVHLRGRSGDGKSALVRRFRAQLPGSDAIVLHGRCREREHVPYKGVDGVVDALSAWLRRLPAAERAELCPPDLDALVRVFPVLDEIWERHEPQILGSNEVRTLGAVTLRKLLQRVTERHRIVVHIDDFQWADRDSVGLLEALVRPPDAPAMLLLLSHRSEATDSEVLDALMASKVLAGARARSIELGPLSSLDARELASSLLRTVVPSGRGAQAEAIALRSRGSPFFITQMALSGQSLASDSNLDHVIAYRLDELEREARDLLELVAVFGGPVDAGLACALCDADPAAVDSLCTLGLLVRDEDARAQGERERIEAAHDRVREFVLEEIDDERERLIHDRIGRQLLARCHGDPQGDSIFAVVDHLVAGAGSSEELPRERRLELGRLGDRAGQRAFDAGAWAAARRYFGVAYALLEPWLAGAREGGEQHELCVEVVFGRARTEIVLDDAQGDALIEDLLEWPLSLSSRCRISEWYTWHLGNSLRTSECIEFGMRALARLGFSLPRRPSWPRAMMSYLWGWRSIQGEGLSQLVSLPTVTDERVRTGMELITAVGGYALYADIKLHLSLMGTYGRMLRRHGLHDASVVALSRFAMFAAMRGKVEDARTLCALTQELAEQQRVSMRAYVESHVTVLMVLALFTPAHGLVSEFEEVFVRACEVAPRPMVEIAGLFCATNHGLASVPCSRALEFVAALEARQEGFMVPMVEALMAETRRMYAALQGLEAFAPVQGLEQLGPEVRGVVAANRMLIAMLLGDGASAWELDRMLARNYERNLGPHGIAPIYAMASVVVMADRWAGSSARERRRMRRMILERRSTAQTWALRCRESYQPLLDLIDGERAALEGRYEDALKAYEQARAVASEQQSHRLVGLASERLAKLARRRGHTILAQGAFDAAREAYETWGATAVVTRLDRERATTAPA